LCSQLKSVAAVGWIHIATLVFFVTIGFIWQKNGTS